MCTFYPNTSIILLPFPPQLAVIVKPSFKYDPQFLHTNSPNSIYDPFTISKCFPYRFRFSFIPKLGSMEMKNKLILVTLTTHHHPNTSICNLFQAAFPPQLTTIIYPPILLFFLTFLLEQWCQRRSSLPSTPVGSSVPYRIRFSFFRRINGDDKLESFSSPLLRIIIRTLHLTCSGPSFPPQLTELLWCNLRYKLFLTFLPKQPCQRKSSLPSPLPPPNFDVHFLQSYLPSNLGFPSSQTKTAMSIKHSACAASKMYC